MSHEAIPNELLPDELLANELLAGELVGDGWLIKRPVLFALVIPSRRASAAGIFR